VKITREVIKVQSIKSKTLEPDYGYVRITQFQSGTADDLKKAIAKLGKENKNLKGVVLDLRNNPGGLLQAAVDVVDTFLSEGLIVYTKGRIPNSDLRYSATKESDDVTVPVVVLINSGSASASEIVAGALQDQHRAVVMGTDSFGKGSVQTVLPLNNDRALKLTTALYYTPSGRSIQAQGIVPDVRVESAKLSRDDDKDNVEIKEADLTGHLSNGNGGADKPGKVGKTEKASTDVAQDNDYQINEALNLLKAMHVMSAQKTPSTIN
jgi:carboxyl-terminal processing protease